MGQRRYLPFNHKWRNDKASFDNEIEHRPPREMFSGYDILDNIVDLDGLLLKKGSTEED